MSNQPPVDGQFEPTPLTEAETIAAANTRQQATRNYELDRTISYTNHDPVSVRRLSVAVVLDDRPALEPTVDGSVNTESWTPEELDRITALVRDVVGYSEERGDSVTVVNNRFAPLTLDEDFGDVPFWQEDWLFSGLKQFLGLALILLLVFGVLRPVLRNLATTGGPGKNLARVAASGEYADLDVDGNPMGDDRVTLSGGDEILLPGPTDGYERQLNAIKGLIAQDPGRVAQVVKHWINDDV